jgi:hypothetical protein
LKIAWKSINGKFTTEMLDNVLVGDRLITFENAYGALGSMFSSSGSVMGNSNE